MGRDNIPTRLETNIPLFPDFRRKARGERETCRKAVSWMSIYNKRSLNISCLSSSCIEATYVSRCNLRFSSWAGRLETPFLPTDEQTSERPNEGNANLSLIEYHAPWL